MPMTSSPLTFADLKPLQVFRVLPGGKWYLRTSEPIPAPHEPAHSLLDLETGKLGWLQPFNAVYDVWESAESFFTFHRIFPVDSADEG